MSVAEAETVSDLVHKLIVSLCGEQKQDVVRRLLRFSLRLLSSSQGTDTLREDEVCIANRIKSKLSSQEAVQFDTLHNELKDGPLANRTNVLMFLLYLGRNSEKTCDRHFSFPEARMGASLPIASTSGQSSQTSYSNVQVVPLSSSETNIRGWSPHPTRIFNEDCISEDVLVQDLIYSFQGIEGRVLKLDQNNGFHIDPSAKVSRWHKQAVLRLSELGYLYNVITSSLDRISKISAGRVADSFIAALHKELSEYYRFIAIIQEEVNRAQNSMGLASVTLSHLHLWAYEPLETLKWLANIVNAAQDRKGGALASAIYEFSHHGDQNVQKLIKRILESVCDPLYGMLMHWIMDGELDDHFKEFFIESCANVTGDRMWHEKYQVRDSMVPSFISMSQAKMILGTGKSINFLREVCKDVTPLQGRNAEAFKESNGKYNVEAFFEMDPDGRLQTMMDAAYKETSARVVEILTKQYQLMDHLSGIKGYLLLGQGHFIQHLMHLLQPELDKHASSLFPHNLTSILETAIRATSSKLDDLDVQRRLDVRCYPAAENETGWDIFVLDYNVDGPIGTILEPCRQKYQTIFFSLWRAKRMETILSQIWKQQTTSAKMFRKMPEVLSVHSYIHLITSSMVHLVHQMQYYFLFEVIECSWDVFTKQVGQTSSLDDIITAHDNFIESVLRGTMLDEESQGLKNHLQSVYAPILELQALEETFLARVTREYESRLQAEKTVEKSNEQVQKWGKTKRSEAESAERQTEFTKYLSNLGRQLKMLSNKYQDRVQKFLMKLASAEDVSLQLLSVRLDFNEYYKNKDSRLVAPLTLQRRRQSDQAYLLCK